MLSIGDRIVRGNRAKALLEDATLVEIFANAQKRAFEEFVTAKTHADSQSAWQTTQAIEALRLEFAAMIGDGQRAEADKIVEERQQALVAKRKPQTTR